MKTQHKAWFAYLMWFFPLLFFAYQFILRLWPSLLMPTIMEHFSIHATQFGLMASLYYYGYAGMQIPVAFLLERFSVKSVVFVSTLCCGVAMICFNVTEQWWLACLSRLVIGVGSVVGFLGTSKVIAQWFPAQRYAQMVGFTFTFGLMGAIYGGKPVSLMIDSLGWQTVAMILGFAAMVIGIGSLMVLREPKEAKQHAEKINFQQFKSLLSMKSLWCLAFANLLMVGSLEGFADVWGVPYLMTAHHINKSDAAALVSFIFIGMLFGGPILAWLSQRLGQYTVIGLCGLGMSFAFANLLLLSDFHWLLFAGILFFMGVLCCYQVIVFSTGLSLVDSQLLGVTVAFLNCINMLGGSFFHTVIGVLMDAHWDGAYLADGVRLYSVASYHFALSVIPLCALLGTALIAVLGVAMSKKLNLSLSYRGT